MNKYTLEEFVRWCRTSVIYVFCPVCKEVFFCCEPQEIVHYAANVNPRWESNLSQHLMTEHDYTFEQRFEYIDREREGLYLVSQVLQYVSF